MAMMKRLMILILLVPALGVRALTLREPTTWPTTAV